MNKMNGLTGAEARELIELRIQVKKQVEKIKELQGSQMQICNGCAELKRHDCFTLFNCDVLGYVNPFRDGCSRKKPGGLIVERGES